jgi:hypothetical protein
MRFVYLLLLSCALIRAADITRDMACFKRIDLPLKLVPSSDERPRDGQWYPIPLEGSTLEFSEQSVVALITAGPLGRVSRIDVSGGATGTRANLKAHLEHAVEVEPACAGRTLELVFTFRIGGIVSRRPRTEVFFQGPNHFIIQKEPQMAYLD